jgi:hypothetical protein
VWVSESVCVCLNHTRKGTMQEEPTFQSCFANETTAQAATILMMFGKMYAGTRVPPEQDMFSVLYDPKSVSGSSFPKSPSLLEP